jgi:uncharacterized protein (TIGR03435 family)
MRIAETIGVVAIATAGLGQQINPSPSFEVASVKRSDPNATKVHVGIAPGGRFTASNATLKMLIRQAFDLRDNQISGGPKWLDSENYDIEAKAGEGVPIPAGPAGGAVLRSMLRSLLIERFGLVFHTESKEEPVYELEVAKGGPKLKAAEVRDGMPQGLRRGNGRLTGMAASIPALASNLSQQLGRPVIDKTALPGTYDFVLDYAATGEPTTQDPSLPSIFTALQERLGLKLISAKARVEILVIDGAQRPPEN